MSEIQFEELMAILNDIHAILILIMVLGSIYFVLSLFRSGGQR